MQGLQIRSQELQVLRRGRRGELIRRTWTPELLAPESPFFSGNSGYDSGKSARDASGCLLWSHPALSRRLSYSVAWSRHFALRKGIQRPIRISAFSSTGGERKLAFVTSRRTNGHRRQS